MARCAIGSYTFSQFWKYWHSSLNKWIIRYIYIPLGGNIWCQLTTLRTTGRHTQIITIWIIFLFVGLWHDLQYQWVAWALMNCAFFSVEIIVTLIAKISVVSALLHFGLTESTRWGGQGMRRGQEKLLPSEELPVRQDWATPTLPFYMALRTQLNSFRSQCSQMQAVRTLSHKR